MITKLNELYQKMLSKYKRGISSTSNVKYDDFKKCFKDKYRLKDEDVYATGAGKNPGNLEVRLSQGVQATKHTALCLVFLIDNKGSENNRRKLTKSTFVTIRKSLGRGKSSYDNIIIFIDSNGKLFPSGLMYTEGSTLKDKLMQDFAIEQTEGVSAEEQTPEQENAINSSPGSNAQVSLNPQDLSNTILYGPPGTGKTFAMQGLVSSLNAGSDHLPTTFHQSLNYEDFVEGIKPVLDSNGNIGYKVEKGIFYQACNKAAKLAGYSSLVECVNDDIAQRKEKFDKAISDNKIVLLCIDEINRGNVASIFGELITLIEESKRLGAEDELTAILPYSKEVFGVPKNIKIVGTMNTADRSIQLLDSALRRRFKFIEFLPDYSAPFKNDDAVTILQNINTRIRCLLNKDSQIGHSYLMFAQSHKDIFLAMVNRIIPLLEEFFYNDILKVRFVLNENDKTIYPFYKEDTAARQAFDEFVSSSDLDSEEKTFYELNYEILTEEDYSNYLKHLLDVSESD